MVFKFLVERFREPSSWMGLFAVASAFGFELTDVQQIALSTFGAILFGAPNHQLNRVLPRKK
jgi:hypothetical protein